MKKKIGIEMNPKFMEIPKVQLKKIKGGLGDTGGGVDEPETPDED